jgi:protein TonB
MAWSGLLLSAAVLGASAPGNGACSKQGPDWRRLPVSPAEYRHAYPAKALREGVSGHAVLNCGVGVAGEPVDCKIMEEQPADLGFGEAALTLSRSYRFRQPCASEPRRIRLPIQFVPPR